MKRKQIHSWQGTKYKKILVPIIMVLFLGCTKQIKIAGSITPIERDQVKAETLLQGDFNSVVYNDYFMPINAIDNEPHEFSGTIHFPETRMTTTIPRNDWMGGNTTLFPEFSLDFVSDGGLLLPVHRGIIYSGERRPYKDGMEFRSLYNIIVGAGIMSCCSLTE